MQLTPMKELPTARAKSEYKNLKDYIERFLDMDAEYVHVSFAPYEFASVYSAYHSFNRIIRIHSLPVKVSVVNSELYLVKNK